MNLTSICVAVAMQLASMSGLNQTQTERLILSQDPDVVNAREIADAIDEETRTFEPIFRNDPNLTKVRRLLVKTMKEESNFVRTALGDSGRSKCLLQVWGAPESTLTDVRACVRAGLVILKWSVKSCPQYPVAGYASGMVGCRSEVAQRISNRRMAFAEGR